MEIISLNLIVARNEEITTAELDDEIVMMNIETGNYYSLGKMGSVIWNMMEHPIMVEKLVIKLSEKYLVTRQQCEVEVLTFLNNMNKEGLLNIK